MTRTIAAALIAVMFAGAGAAQELKRTPDGKLMGKVLDEWTELSPSRFCAGAGSDDTDVSRCHQLPADEFLPLSIDEFVELNNGFAELSRCVLRYQLRNPKPDFFGNGMDDKLWRRVIRAGKAKDLFSEASMLPGYISADEVASLSDRDIKKRFPEVIWDLQNYSMGADRRQIDALRAKSIYQKYTAMGTKGECAPGETFTRLLEKAANP